MNFAAVKQRKLVTLPFLHGILIPTHTCMYGALSIEPLACHRRCVWCLLPLLEKKLKHFEDVDLKYVLVLQRSTEQSRQTDSFQLK
jgi:hypothetical protein